MSKPTDVDSYIANARPEARPILKELRKIIRTTIPEAEEGISYNVPFYTFHDTHVGFSAATNHATFGIGADTLQREDRKILEEKGYKNRERDYSDSIQSSGADPRDFEATGKESGTSEKSVVTETVLFEGWSVI